MADESQVIVFIPALAVLLLRAEHLKGSPLTEEEALSVRDNAIVVKTSPEQARAVTEKRGYDDIDPADCWAQWQALRKEIMDQHGR